jgi:hypothetical protein
VGVSIKREQLGVSNMEAGRVTLSIVLATLLALSTLVAPTTAQVADDPKQPSIDNSMMYVWGTQDLGNCWTHFDSNDTATHEEGFGMKEFSQGSQVNVDYQCRLQDSLKEDMHLDPNGTIAFQLGFSTWSGDCEDDGNDSNCMDLTITLSKGSLDVATKQFPAVSTSGDDEQILWDIPVDNNTVKWSFNGEDPIFRIQYSKPGYNGLECFVQDCAGEFKMYYSNNQEGMKVDVKFPIINVSDVVDPNEEVASGSGDSGLPGFGLIAGLGALAMAAVLVSNKPEE